MPAPIIAAFTTYFRQNLNIVVWPEEVPRYDTSGNPINPEATATPTIWPVLQMVMGPGFNRENTFVNAYSDNSDVFTFRAWGYTKASVDAMMDDVEVALVNPDNWYWFGSPIGILLGSTYSIYDLELSSWSSVQRENERLAKQQLVWVAEMLMRLKIHGSVNSVGT